MNLVKNEYLKLSPQGRYLSDQVVLALAWKKAHQYIRRHNWYADVLELDCSAINLQANLMRWSDEVRQGKFLPQPARLVPAPKNACWSFHTSLSHCWAPTKEIDPSNPDAGLVEEKLYLRPLAHLGLREQTAATAVMICLADCVESAQGNPSVGPEQALTSGVYSYGNRLYCQWSDDQKQATFSWGSGDTYSRYYKDYQQFVNRPHAIAARLEKDGALDERCIYIVKLDITAFFDNIDRKRLISALRKEYRRYSAGHPQAGKDDDLFWATTEQILSFSWATSDQKFVGLLKNGHLPNGLPQGLVASGFLANAYLLSFDRTVGNACLSAKQIGPSPRTLQLHDYCRYVDDIRLVVTAPLGLSEAEVSQLTSGWIQQALNETTSNRINTPLEINPAKTEVEAVSHIAGATGVATRMKQLQQRLSGPFDLSSLHQTEIGLSGLLSSAELASRNQRHVVTSKLPAIAAVAKPQLDVRDDTLIRFAAYRLSRTLRERRMLTDLSEEKDGKLAADVLRQDFEMTARRLIAAWTSNPSMVQVLRFALDLFPSHALIQDVLAALAQKIVEPPTKPDQAAVAWYVVAEILRAAATETGRRASKDDNLQVGDTYLYRDWLAGYAENLLQSGETPWFVQQQAALLLATLGSSTDQLQPEPELIRYALLHDYLGQKEPNIRSDLGDLVSAAIVGHQLTGQDKAFKDWFNKLLQALPIAKRSQALELVLLASRKLFDLLVPDSFQGLRTTSLPAEVVHISRLRELLLVGGLPNERMTLAEAIEHPSRVFQHENALVHLGVALTRELEACKGAFDSLSPYDIYVRSSDWSALNVPASGSPLEVQINKKTLTSSCFYQTPEWCQPTCAWMYAIGRLLRAAAVGNVDFTMTGMLGSSEIGWYRGMPSTSVKRRLGMNHSSQALGGTSSAVTPWFSGLLTELLRWPGVATDQVAHEARTIQSITDLRLILERRLAHQASLYGASSRSPIYRFPVRWPVNKSKMLRIATVQGLMPTEGEFKDLHSSGMTSAYRDRHRNHTAALLKLAADKISARSSALGKPHRPEVDLVVFPEYAIHTRDQDLLRAFADSTGAMLHYGLLGAKHPLSGENTNAARWLIPVRSKDRSRRSWIQVDQGKLHLTDGEKQLGIAAWCPYRIIIDLCGEQEPTGFRMAGAICYDATDISLAADLRDESHLFVVPAMNRDIKTFDSMVSALRYHMYQHVVVSNAGAYGGSTAQAPYAEEHRRVISHSHGENQISVSLFDIDMSHFGPALHAASFQEDRKQKPQRNTKRLGKTPPAGLRRRLAQIK